MIMPLRILIVKTSSLGDIVHNLPVISDLRLRFPDAEIDWVVEEGFGELPVLHPGIRRVYVVAVRRWRRSLFRRQTWQEITAFRSVLAACPYDIVLDTQGLLKSAWIAQLTQGVRHGLDWASAREPLAVFYDHTHAIPWTAHAVERNRQLAAEALDYRLEHAPSYGIRAAPMQFDCLGTSRYVVLMHATSASEKLWPEDRWMALGSALGFQGFACVFPWGNDGERERAQRLSRGVAGAVVPDRFSLSAMASLLAGASGVAGTDTGLTHLAGALGVPTVGIYCATDPDATGLYACDRAANLGSPGQCPESGAVLDRLLSLMES